MIRIALYSLISLSLLTSVFVSGINAASIDLSITATVLSKNRCRFMTPNTVLDFGLLDPLNPVNVTTSTTIDFRCQGADAIASYLISKDDGLYPAGPGSPRMQNTLDAAEHIPYSLTLNPAAGTTPKLVSQTLTITGDILGSNYQFAKVGIYNDTVTLTILP